MATQVSLVASFVEAGLCEKCLGPGRFVIYTDFFYHFEMQAKQLFWKPSIYSKYNCYISLRKRNGRISTYHCKLYEAMGGARERLALSNSNMM